MKISTKGRYGLRAVIDLAIHSNGEYVSLSSIAERQGLSINYLEHAFSALKKAGLITGHTGYNGGYKLIDDPENITIQMILNVLEGDLSIIEKVNELDESPLQRCIRMNLWNKIDENVTKIIAGTTLKDMMNKYQNNIEQNSFKR